MAQIKKAKRGLQLAQINDLIQLNDALLNNVNIDEDRKALARAVLQSQLNVINQANFTDRDKRLYQLDMAQRVNNILTGKQAYSESTAGNANQNIFGYYSAKTEIPYLANETVKQTISSKNNEPYVPGSYLAGTGYSPSSSSGEGFMGRSEMAFNPFGDFSTTVLPDTKSSYKIKEFASHLLRKFQEFPVTSYDPNKHALKGLSEDALTRIPEFINTLNSIISQDAPSNENILTLSKVVSALGNDDYKELFNQYFAKELGATPTGTKVGNGVVGQNEEDEISNVFNKYKDYTDLQLDGTSKYYVQLDPTKDDYKKLYHVDQNGNLIKQYDLSSELDITELNNKNLWTSIANGIRTANKSKYQIKDYSEFGGKKGIDFSNMFSDKDQDGNNIIHFAETGDFDFDNGDIWIPYSSWFSDWDNIKENFKYSGNTDIDMNGKSMNNQYELSTGYSEDESFLTASAITDEEINANFGLNDDNHGLINETTSWYKFDYNYKFLLSDTKNKESKFSKDRFLEFVKLYELQQAGIPTDIDTKFPNNSTKCKNGNQLGYEAIIQLYNNRELYLSVLKRVIKETSDPKLKKILIQRYKEAVAIPKNKEGGILKLFQGGASDPSKRTNSSYSVISKQSTTAEPIREVDNKLTELTDKQKAALGLTVLSAINDIGLIFNPEPISSAAQSVAGLAADFTADRLSGRSWGETLTNAGVNTLFGIGSVIPLVGNATSSLKAAKVLSKIGKTWNALGFSAGALIEYLGITDPKTKTTVQNIFNNPEAVSIEDAMDLLNLIRGGVGIAGGARGIRRSHLTGVKENPNATFVKTRNPNGKVIYKKVTPDLILSVNTKVEELNKDLHFWNVFQKRDNKVKAILDLAGGEQGITVPTSFWMRDPITTPDLYIPEPAKASKDSYMRRNPKRSKQFTSPDDMKPYEPGVHWWNEINFDFKNPFNHIKASVRKKLSSGEQVLGVDTFDEINKAGKQFHYNLTEVTGNIPAELKAIVGNSRVYFDPNAKVYIFDTSGVKTTQKQTTSKEKNKFQTNADASYEEAYKKSGGKLLRLQNSLNNK